MNEHCEGLSATAGETLASKTFPLSEEEKAEWARRFRKSGLSIRKFCAQHDLPRMSLWRWVNRGKQIKDPVACSAPVQFEEIKLPPRATESHWGAEMTLPNGTVLRLSRELPMALFEQLLRIC